MSYFRKRKYWWENDNFERILCNLIQFEIIETDEKGNCRFYDETIINDFLRPL